MQGRVKWYAKDKGYGFIVTENGKEFYFNGQDVKGNTWPREGDVVSFAAKQGNKGERAVGVLVDLDAAKPKKHDLQRQKEIGTYATPRQTAHVILQSEELQTVGHNISVPESHSPLSPSHYTHLS